MNKEDLISFEKEISEDFLQKKIKVPIHLSGGNEDILIDIFKNIKKEDWTFFSHRNHYHALLKGFQRHELKDYIINGECGSMLLYNRKLKIFSSGIVGGILPLAIGTAIGIKKSGGNNKVWVFVGDMASEMGIFHECSKYATRNNLPIIFVIEDNGMSVDSPTQKVWGEEINSPKIIKYKYNRIWNHVGPGLDGQKLWVVF
jgi:pyruvate dehydrogenase E1 component alpha subunit